MLPSPDETMEAQRNDGYCQNIAQIIGTNALFTIKDESVLD